MVPMFCPQPAARISGELAYPWKYTLICGDKVYHPVFYVHTLNERWGRDDGGSLSDGTLSPYQTESGGRLGPTATGINNHYDGAFLSDEVKLGHRQRSSHCDDHGDGRVEKHLQASSPACHNPDIAAQALVSTGRPSGWNYNLATAPNKQTE
ncbi:hypothetical protein JB92DRAFT_2825464 [Gautieria morchelliformis]|nr:hypothetical protein JB92DRAFT_2825464 [Gautieria morchelliformis]